MTHGTAADWAMAEALREVDALTPGSAPVAPPPEPPPAPPPPPPARRSPVATFCEVLGARRDPFEDRVVLPSGRRIDGWEIRSRRPEQWGELLEPMDVALLGARR